jgi:hypothetical protein
MKQEDKELLIKDLCARLPYGVYVEHISGFRGILHNITVYFTYNDDDTIKDYICHTDFFKDELCKIEFFKPYLFPMSSMTEEQKETYCQLQQKVIYNSKGVVNKDVMNYINWCYENHLDVNDLIPKGLALDATNLNIY